MSEPVKVIRSVFIGADGSVACYDVENKPMFSGKYTTAWPRVLEIMKGQTLVPAFYDQRVMKAVTQAAIPQAFQQGIMR